MNGRTKRYKESLLKTSDPVLLSQSPHVQLDLKGIMQYAKEQGKNVAELTEQEKNRFIK